MIRQNNLGVWWWIFIFWGTYVAQLHALDACCTSCGVTSFEECINHSVILDTPLMTKVHGASWPWISSKAASDPHVYFWILSGGHFGSSALEGLIATSNQVSTLCGASVWQCEGEKLLIKTKDKRTGESMLPVDVRNTLVRGERSYEVVEKNITRVVEIKPMAWDKVLRVFSEVWNMSKPVLLDKSPAFLLLGPDIAHACKLMGKRCAFLVLSRSACTMSTKQRTAFLKKKRDGSDDFPRLPNAQLFNWNRTSSILIHTLRRLQEAGENVLHVRYEDMMLAPNRVIENIYKFLPILGRLNASSSGISDADYPGRLSRLRSGKDDGRRHKPLAWFIDKYPLQNTCTGCGHSCIHAVAFSSCVVRHTFLFDEESAVVALALGYIRQD
eukprot:m.717907 g.717907  ORF g.717907 m.717907 type:complete len:385 (+) comp22990_c0_seq1:198-1352(+)